MLRLQGGSSRLTRRAGYAWTKALMRISVSARRQHKPTYRPAMIDGKHNYNASRWRRTRVKQTVGQYIVDIWAALNSLDLPFFVIFLTGLCCFIRDTRSTLTSAMSISAHQFTAILAVLLLVGTTLERIGLPATTSTVATPTRPVDARENDAEDIGIDGVNDNDHAAAAVPNTFVRETPDELLSASLPFFAELDGRQRHRTRNVDDRSYDYKSGSLDDCSTLLYALTRPSKQCTD